MHIYTDIHIRSLAKIYIYYKRKYIYTCIYKPFNHPHIHVYIYIKLNFKYFTQGLKSENYLIVMIMDQRASEFSSFATQRHCPQIPIN